MKSLKVFSIFYLLLSFAFFLYSYTQVDLSLTLSKASIFQTVEKAFQNIGWYQRPLSTVLFLAIVICLFLSYFYLLYLSYKNKISRKFFWGLIIATSGILVLSYNAFSYDLFNYIFDAKIFTHYHQNPYLHKALDFPGDPMLSFMRWTHRTYPYGPIWLAVTIPLSFIGANIFLPTFFIFKIAIGLFFLGSIYFLEKIVTELNIKNKFFPLVFFAFNPLTLIECLVSSHNDIVMMFFALLGFYLFLKRKIVLSIVLIVISYLVKSVTIFLLIPVFTSIGSGFIKFKISSENILRIAVFSLILGFAYVITQIEIQPWYFIWVLPFIGLLKPNRFVISLAICFTIGMILTYFPYIFINNFANGVIYKIYLLPLSLAVGLAIPLILTVIKKPKLEL